MGKRRIIIGGILFICLVFAVSYPIIISNLIIDEEPVQSDVIIVTEGQMIVRAYRASELLHEGFSNSGQIIVSPITEANAQGYQTFGVSKEQVIPETEATSTYENAVISLEMMEDYEYDSAIIVSSDYHMLRTKMIYERVNENYNYNLTYVAAYHLVEDEFVPWYEAGTGTKAAANREFWKYWGYLLGLYHFFNL
ncbi:DUF218 domain-containing protein [Desemzia incerta]|uniref:DUF218 domain-containing protein n=1 Tax=Desemzia incerta TaxID=82801 RepID=A0A1I5X593_9LACT|nr:YdcF family protein [Desemzia incerta]SFQ27130.1 DUF218 domain-containing protein [Desemzia incerta]